MVAITLKEGFSDRLTRTMLLFSEAAYAVVRLAFVKNMVKRLARKSRPQLAQTLDRIRFFQEHIDALTADDRAQIDLEMARMENTYERLIPTLSEVASDSPELDDIYTLALQLENEIAFLRARL